MQHLSRYLMASALVFSLFMVAHDANAESKEKTAICHATSSETNPYTFLNLPPEPLSAHFDERGTSQAGHEKDFFPADSDCDVTNDGGVVTPPPTATPEPITMLLFGAGLAGAGYVSRRYFRKGNAENGDDETE